MNYKYSFTAYLNGPSKFVEKESRLEAQPSPQYSQLDDYSRRLNKQNQKLNNLSEQCMASLSKINNYCSQASTYFILNRRQFS